MIRPAFAQGHVPIGRQAAKKIPWWASTKVRINSSNGGGGNTFPLYGQVEREAFIRNPFAWPIFITEIRMWSNPIYLYNRSAYWNSMKKAAFRFDSSRTGNVNSKWLPGMAFNTETDRHLMGHQSGIVYTLPADYYLSHGVTPLVELIALEGRMDDFYIQTAMRGYDPTTNTPIVVSGRLDTAGTAGANTAVFAYADERDQAVRDMWIHDFTFSVISVYGGESYYHTSWLNLSARFQMPEGPHWTLDERTPLIALADQVPAFNLGGEVQEGSLDETPVAPYYPDPPVIHRPVTPHVLLPGDLFTGEVRLLDNTFWTLAAEVPPGEGEHPEEIIDIWVHFKGYQEGTYVD